MFFSAIYMLQFFHVLSNKVIVCFVSIFLCFCLVICFWDRVLLYSLRLASNWISSCLRLLSAWIIGGYHHTQLDVLLLSMTDWMETASYFAFDFHYPFICGAGVWIQGFVLARQGLSHFHHAPCLFALLIFLDRVLLFAIGWPWTINLFPMTST
jgi:hypothetical protein